MGSIPIARLVWYPLSMKYERLVSFLLRAGVATVFLYAAVAATLEPTAWVGFFPQFLRALIPDRVLLTLFSLYELTLGLWVLSGRKTFYAGLLASATLLAIIVVNITLLDIVFRDIAIFFAALALVFFNRRS